MPESLRPVYNPESVVSLVTDFSLWCGRCLEYRVPDLRVSPQYRKPHIPATPCASPVRVSAHTHIHTHAHTHTHIKRRASAPRHTGPRVPFSRHTGLRLGYRSAPGGAGLGNGIRRVGSGPSPITSGRSAAGTARGGGATRTRTAPSMGGTHNMGRTFGTFGCNTCNAPVPRSITGWKSVLPLLKNKTMFNFFSETSPLEDRKKG